MKGLAVCRIKANLTQIEAATKLGKDRSTIAKWETEASSPNADDLPAIASLYNCSIDDLFKKEEVACG